MTAKREKSTHPGIQDKMLTKVLNGINEEEEVGPMGCHLWMGAQTAAGFGAVRDGKKVVLVHRWLAERFLPCPNMPSLVVGHLCGNQLCCRLDHLVWLSTVENGAMAAKQGKFPGKQKLTDRKVIAARHLMATGETKCADLARRFEIDLSTLNHAVRGKTFRHLDAEHPPYTGSLFLGNGGRGQRRPHDYNLPGCRAFMTHLGLAVDEGDLG